MPSKQQVLRPVLAVHPSLTPVNSIIFYAILLMVSCHVFRFMWAISTNKGFWEIPNVVLTPITNSMNCGFANPKSTLHIFSALTRHDCQIKSTHVRLKLTITHLFADRKHDGRDGVAMYISQSLIYAEESIDSKRNPNFEKSV